MGRPVMAKGAGLAIRLCGEKAFMFSNRREAADVNVLMMEAPMNI